MGLDRPPAGGEVAQHGDVEVAVGRQRERARDRRRGHVQHVRGEAVRRLAVERAALVDAEAVLLVDDRDREPVEGDAALDQRVGADQQLQLARRELAQQVRAARRGRRAGQQRGLDQLARHQRLERGEVLLGERLRRRHQRRLGAVLDRPQHRVERDDGLAGARPPPSAAAASGARVARSSSIAAIAGRWSSVGVNGSDAASQRSVSDGGSSSTSARAASRRSARRRSIASWSSSSSSKASRRAPELAAAEVRGAERAGAVGPAAGGADPGRQRLDDVAQRRAVVVHEGGDLRRREALRGRVGGDVAGRPDELPGLGVELHPEAVAALVLALQHQPRAGAVAALEPRLVEERGLHDPGLVGDGGLDQRLHPAAADRARGDRAHLDGDRGDLVHAQLGDRARLRAVARQVLEQVADRVEPEPLGALGGGRRLELERRGEAARPRQPRAVLRAQLVVAERRGRGEGERRASAPAP